MMNPLNRKRLKKANSVRQLHSLLKALAVGIVAGCTPGVFAETSVTLVTYNIHVGVPMGEGIGQYKVATADLDNLAGVIRETGGDIVALQEVDCEYGLSFPDRRRSSLLNEARYLAGALGDKCYIFGSAQDETGYPTDNGKYVEWGHPDKWTNNSMPHGEVGNALLWNSQWKMAGAPENLELPKDPGQERRASIVARFLVPTGNGAAVEPVNVYAAHLQHNSGETRYKQLAAILDHAEGRKEELVFILGDLNHELDPTETSNPIQLALDRGFYDLAAPSAGEDATGYLTYPADNPDRRIDFILCNRAVNVLEKKVLRSLASDHLPVLVTVSW